MKKILIAATVSCFTLLLQAQNNKTEMQTDTAEIEMDSVSIEYMKLPDSTAIGAADGKPVSKEIGPAGGKMISDDGRVELIFPESALKVNTTISVQPIINLIPNGNGKAYRFEPSGIQFQKPVQIIFHYTDEEAEVCPPELKFMALQDHNGKWEYMSYEDWDSAAKTLKGSIEHFSAMVDGNLAELNATKIILKPGQTYPLFLTIVQPPAEPAAPGEDELPPFPKYVNKNDKNVVWKVNKSTGRSVKHGTIAANKGKRISALYTAPEVLTADPITINLLVTQYMMETITERWGKKGRIQSQDRKKTGEASFTCKVKLYDEYKIDVYATGVFSLECEAELSDHASYELVVYPDKAPDINKVNNEDPVITKQARCKKGYPLTYDAAGCVGPVNVRKSLLMGYGMTYGRGSDAPEYRLEFSVMVVRMATGKGKYPEQIRSSYTENATDLNVGNEVRFKLNRKKQTYDFADEDCNCKIKIIVTPI